MNKLKAIAIFLSLITVLSTMPAAQIGAANANVAAGQQIIEVCGRISGDRLDLICRRAANTCLEAGLERFGNMQNEIRNFFSQRGDVPTNLLDSGFANVNDCDTQTLRPFHEFANTIYESTKSGLTVVVNRQRGPSGAAANLRSCNDACLRGTGSTISFGSCSSTPLRLDTGGTPATGSDFAIGARISTRTLCDRGTAGGSCRQQGIDCGLEEYCVCSTSQVAIQAQTGQTGIIEGFNTASIPGTRGFLPDPADITETAPRRPSNDLDCEQVSKVTLQAEIHPQLVATGTQLTITGSVTKFSRTCNGVSLDCRMQYNAQCRADNGFFQNCIVPNECRAGEVEIPGGNSGEICSTNTMRIIGLALAVIAIFAIIVAPFVAAGTAAAGTAAPAGAAGAGAGAGAGASTAAATVGYADALASGFAASGSTAVSAGAAGAAGAGAASGITAGQLTMAATSAANTAMQFFAQTNENQPETQAPNDLSFQSGDRGQEFTDASGTRFCRQEDGQYAPCDQVTQQVPAVAPPVEIRSATTGGIPGGFGNAATSGGTAQAAGVESAPHGTAPVQQWNCYRQDANNDYYFSSGPHSSLDQCRFNCRFGETVELCSQQPPPNLVSPPNQGVALSGASASGEPDYEGMTNNIIEFYASPSPGQPTAASVTSGAEGLVNWYELSFGAPPEQAAAYAATARRAIDAEQPQAAARAAAVTAEEFCADLALSFTEQTIDCSRVEARASEARSATSVNGAVAAANGAVTETRNVAAAALQRRSEIESARVTWTPPQNTPSTASFTPSQTQRTLIAEISTASAQMSGRLQRTLGSANVDSMIADSGMAGNYNELMLKIARQESGINHCASGTLDCDGSSRGSVSNGISSGIMQINLDTENLGQLTGVRNLRNSIPECTNRGIYQHACNIRVGMGLFNDKILAARRLLSTQRGVNVGSITCQNAECTFSCGDLTETYREPVKLATRLYNGPYCMGYTDVNFVSNVRNQNVAGVRLSRAEFSSASFSPFGGAGVGVAYAFEVCDELGCRDSETGIQTSSGSQPSAQPQQSQPSGSCPARPNPPTCSADFVTTEVTDANNCVRYECRRAPGRQALQTGGQIGLQLGTPLLFSASNQLPSGQCYNICGRNVGRTPFAAAPVCPGYPVAAREGTLACGEQSCGGFENREVRITVKNQEGRTIQETTVTTDSDGQFSHTFTAPSTEGNFIAVVTTEGPVANLTTTARTG